MSGFTARLNTHLWFTVILSSMVLMIGRMAAASISDNLSGYVNLSGVQSQSDSTTRSSVRREISGNWYRNLSEYLVLRTSVSYFQTDLDRTHLVALNKKEFSPDISFSFGHPKVTFNGKLSRFETRGTLVADELTRDVLLLTMSTRFAKAPILRANYYKGRVYGDSINRGQNARSDRLGLDLFHDFSSWTARYRFNYTTNLNEVTELKSASNHHGVKLAWTKRMPGRRQIRLFGDYRFDYNKRTDRLPLTEILFHIVAPANGIYSQNEDAYSGRLEQMPSLTDNDDTSATDPEIDIGTGTTNRQVGVYLEIPREVSGLYIYTDRLSDEGMNWSVYISDDGLNWEDHDLQPDVIFEVSVNRYEIAFETIKTKFIKAISDGLNRIETVHVTEIQPVAEVQADNELTQTNQSHSINGGAGVQFSERWSANADISYRRVPQVGLAGRRQNFSQSTSIYFKASPNLDHSARLQYGLNATSGDSQDYTDLSLSYNIRYTPLPTLRLTGSAFGRRTLLDGNRDTDNRGVTGRITGEPLPDLTFELGAGYSLDKRHTLDQISDDWRLSINLNGKPGRAIAFRLSYSHQISDVRGPGQYFERDRYGVNLILRPVQKVYLRSSADWSGGEHYYLTKKVSVSWTLSSAFSLSGSYRTTKNDKNFRSERMNANINWRMISGNTLFLGYNKSNLSRAGGNLTESISAGVRVRL